MACKFVLLIIIILPWNYRQSTQWYLKHQLLACSPLLLFLCLYPGLQIHFLHFFQIFWTELWKIAVGTWHFSTMVRVIELCRYVLLGEGILTSNANLKTVRTFSPMGLHKFSTREPKKSTQAPCEAPTKHKIKLTMAQVFLSSHLQVLHLVDTVSQCMTISMTT